METIKKIFPYSFKEKKDLGALIITILLHIAVGFAVGVVIGVLSYFLGKVSPILTLPLSLVSSAAGLYLTAGIVFNILHYVKVIK